MFKILRLTLAAALCAALGVVPAEADWTAKNATNQVVTFFAFTCFTTKICSAHVPVDQTGAPLGVSGNPFVVQFPSAQAVTLSSVPSHNVTNAGTFAVQAAQSGNYTVRNQDGAGNALTSATRGAQQALSVQVVDASGNQVTTFGGSGGTASNFGSAFPTVGTAIGISDGTNMRAFLGAANALNSTGTGLGTAQIIGQFDDLSPTSITENQFGNIRMSANRNLYGTIRDAAGNERGVNVDASNRLTTAPSLISGAVASGAFASGSVASGAFASGSIASGAMVDLGAVADAAATAGGTGTLSAKLRLMTTQLATLNTTLGSPLQAGGNIGNITGSVSLPTGAATAAKQPALGTAGTASNDVITVQGAASMVPLRNFIWDAAGNARGANVNSSNQLSVSVDGGSVFNANGQTTMTSSSPVTMASDQRVSTANASVKIDVSTATTTQLVALSSGLKVYVTALDVIAGGTGNIKFVYGTGSNCGTGTTDLTGNYNLTAQAGIAKGAGVGAVLVVPASNALCVTTSAAVQMSGSVSYQQF